MRVKHIQAWVHELCVVEAGYTVQLYWRLETYCRVPSGHRVCMSMS